MEKIEALRRLEELGKHKCSYDEREGGCPVCLNIVGLMHTLSTPDEAATLTVGISGASAAMQVGGMPRRGQIEPDAVSFGYVTDPDSIDRLVMELKQRRIDQDAKWGGPNHDDTHTPSEWIEGIRQFTAVALSDIQASRSAEMTPWDRYEDHLMDVAALAIAAIQSSRRINHHGRD